MSTSDQEVGILGRLSVRVSMAVLMVVITLVAFALYLLFPEMRSHVIFAAALVGGSSAVYAAYYAASTLRVSVKRDMQARSFDILASLNEHQAAKLRVFIEKEVANRRLSPEALYDRITQDADCLAVVTTVLGLYEDTAVAIHEGFADERPLYRSLAFLVPWTLRQLREYIEEERKRGRAEDLYIDLQRLAEAWSNGRFYHDGKPIPKNLLARTV